MTKRWNTQKIMIYGAVFGVLYNVIRIVGFEYGWPQTENGYISLVATAVGGAAGGAVLFGLVSGTRNLILKAK